VTVVEDRAYSRIEEEIASGRCVILDGGVATEIERLQPLGLRPDTGLWGTWALYRAPQLVLDVHRRYVEAGCDVISTDTWSILSAPESERQWSGGERGLVHWMDVARLGIRLARKAVADSGRGGRCAVAFAISEEVNSPQRLETVELLRRIFEEEPPDLILLETLTLIRDPSTFRTLELLLGSGIPVWLSFRRCRHGVCGVYGQHWGPPEGDLFGRAAHRFEEFGAGALLINCLPVDHVPGMLSWLRDFTELPLGVYPNLGHLAGTSWKFDDRIDPARYAELALEWRAEGAQIIGGCCGVTVEHIAALPRALGGTLPGRRRPSFEQVLAAPEQDPGTTVAPWLDDRGRSLFPLAVPDLVLDPGVFVPTSGSFLVWKHLFQTGAGSELDCLDVGCGCGIQTVQLALNGAPSVRAIDVDRNAVANTAANAFRNGVGDRVTCEEVDLYQWEPDRSFDLIVASLFQMPVDPYEEPSGHRPLDYWGRTMIDHFYRILPRLLAAEGRALIMQLSIVGQARTAQLLLEGALESRVIDYAFVPFGPLFEQNKDQIERVEHFSDAYHLHLGEQNMVVAYLVEVARPSRAR
jgi:S-methylmethionine-dependent homocysteine/selenocysteine methylase/SAM-dependent methyltransferase